MPGKDLPWATALTPHPDGLPLQKGWVPPEGWQPDPSWPPAPDGWQFWVPDGSAGQYPPQPQGMYTPLGGQPPKKKSWVGLVVAIAAVAVLFLVFFAWGMSRFVGNLGDLVTPSDPFSTEQTAGTDNEDPEADGQPGQEHPGEPEDATHEDPGEDPDSEPEMPTLLGPQEPFLILDHYSSSGEVAEVAMFTVNYLEVDWLAGELSDDCRERPDEGQYIRMDVEVQVNDDLAEEYIFFPSSFVFFDEAGNEIGRVEPYESGMCVVNDIFQDYWEAGEYYSGSLIAVVEPGAAAFAYYPDLFADEPLPAYVWDMEDF